MPRFAFRTRLSDLVAIIERHPVWWVGIVVAVFLIRNYFWHDISQFGQFHDDTLYFSSAKALAEGRGYVIPSLPGTPYQTKYPILYPWLLSWIWRFDPDFPGNVRWAYLLTSLFGAGFVAGCYALSRSLGQRVIVALLITAAGASHPMTQFLSAAVLSDIPFMAFGVWAMALAARWLDETDRRNRKRLLVSVIALVTLAVLTRSIGMGVLAGILTAGAMRRAWRETLLVALMAGAPILIWFGWASLHRVDPEALRVATEGYRQTLLFYTDYLGFWRVSVPDAGIAASMALRNASMGILDVGLMIFGDAWEIRNRPLFGVLLISMAGFIIREALRGGAVRAHPAQSALPLYCALVVFWNFALASRLMVLFLPLLLVATYRMITKMLRRTTIGFRERARALQVAAILGVAALAGTLIFTLYSHLWAAPRRFAHLFKSRAAELSLRLAAYSWLEQNTRPDVRVISYEDGLLYLHTGRQGIRPLQLTTAPSYSPERFPAEIETLRMPGVARAIEADFWLDSDGDWSAESLSSIGPLNSAVDKTVATCPIVAKFGNSAVVIRKMEAGRCAGPPASLR